jgi:hypothetical protein
MTQFFQLFNFFVSIFSKKKEMDDFLIFLLSFEKKRESSVRLKPEKTNVNEK